jgi:hypothetical protein
VSGLGCTETHSWYPVTRTRCGGLIYAVPLNRLKNAFTTNLAGIHDELKDIVEGVTVTLSVWLESLAL